MKAGFVGLGRMGHAMAGNLLAAGHDLCVWNRTADKADDLLRQGARVAATPADVVEEGGLVVTMLSDDAALRAVTEGPAGLAARLGRNGVHVSMSTVSPATADALDSLHRNSGAHYVSAPVFGRPEAAAARKLFILAAGAPQALDRAQPLFDAMGQKVFPLGERPALANVVKLSGNFMIMAALEAMAEACTLGEKYGLERSTVIDVMTQTLFPAPLYVNYGKTVAEHVYTPAGFKLALGLKDANLVLAAADAVQCPMPLAQLAKHRFLSSVAKSRGDIDWAGIALDVAEDAGLPGRP
jgi:3-hydroxyisobutyrate dehydrogenase-like beta-hydroxyacid dehydrogenase